MAPPKGQLPLILSVKRNKGSWRENDTELEPKDQAFRDVREDVLRLNDYRCKFCGFEAKKYQHVHHRDNDHGNQNKGNLLATCAYCHQAHHLGFSGLGGENILIHFSARNQAWINHISRLYFVSKLQGQNQWSKKIAGLYKTIREEGLRNLHLVYGQEMSGMKSEDPLWLANFLMGLDTESYQDRVNWGSNFNSLRLLPVADKDIDRLKYWKGIISPVDEWGLIVGDETLSSHFN